MIDTIVKSVPANYNKLLSATEVSGFTMASEALTCSLLRTLAATKRSGQFLELGTGTGLSTCWILDGMDAKSSLVSVDNDQRFLDVAEKYLGNDSRLTLECADGAEWLSKNRHRTFDYIFADTWHGKYLMLDEVLSMLNTGGLYIIDDMLPQPNWPDGHDKKAETLLQYLDTRDDLFLTRQSWASGIVIGVKR